MHGCNAYLSLSPSMCTCVYTSPFSVSSCSFSSPLLYARTRLKHEGNTLIRTHARTHTHRWMRWLLRSSLASRSSFCTDGRVQTSRLHVPCIDVRVCPRTHRICCLSLLTTVHNPPAPFALLCVCGWRSSHVSCRGSQNLNDEGRARGAHTRLRWRAQQNRRACPLPPQQDIHKHGLAGSITPRIRTRTRSLSTRCTLYIHYI